MIKKISLILCVILLTSAITILAQDDITVIVDGNEVVFDQKPILFNDRTLVPLRAIFEALGANVEWIGETETVFARKRFNTISLQINSNTIFINEIPIQIDVPAMLLNNRTLVPVRAISEALGARVSWDGENKIVTILGNQKEHYVFDKYLSHKENTADNSKVLIEGIFAYPVILNNTNSLEIANINAEFEKTANDNLENLKTNLVAIANEDYVFSETEGLMFSNHLYSQMFDITYDQNNIFSVTWSDYYYNGEVYPTTTNFSKTYDLTSGEVLDAQRIALLTGYKDSNELYLKAIEKFNTLAKDTFFDDDVFAEQTIENIKNEILSAQFYLKDSKIVFYFNPGQVAPSSVGIFEISIDF